MPPTTNDASPDEIRIGDAEELQTVIAGALENEQTLEVIGAGTKRSYGRPVTATHTISVRDISGVVDYQPTELILVVRPGTPLREVESLIAEQGQMLAFEPPTWDEQATIGGVVACNLSGPRRFKSGAARDHLLGFQAVTGRGEIIRGGGRVVKNVTGYDMSKLMCGSFGTLAVFTELCLKVLPRPKTERTVAVVGLDDEQVMKLFNRVSRSFHEVSGMAHLCEGSSLPPEVAGAAGSKKSITLLRVEGPQASVIVRSEALVEFAERQSVFLEEDESRSVWRAIRELEPLPIAPGECLWRVSAPPAQAAALAAELQRLGESRRVYDWCGALVWIALPADADATALHNTVRQAGGHARLQRFDEKLPQNFMAFSPMAAGVDALNKNLKRAFDPQGVLNPERMYPGW